MPTCHHVRWLLGSLGIVWGVQLLVFRGWWSRFLTATNWGGAPDWFPRFFPYVGFAAMMVWSLIMFTGWFGAL